MHGNSLLGLLPSLEAVPDGDPAILAPSADGSGFLLRPFVGPLVISYIVDEGDSDRALRHRDLLAIGLDEQTELHEQAIANLAGHVKTVGIRPRLHGSMMTVAFDGDLEATLMLYPPLWAQLSENMGDELVVAVPARDVLAVSPLDSPEGIVELQAVVKRVWPRDDHPLTTELFLFSEGNWSIWKATWSLYFFTTARNPRSSMVTRRCLSRRPTARLKAFLLRPNRLRITSGLDDRPPAGHGVLGEPPEFSSASSSSSSCAWPRSESSIFRRAARWLRGSARPGRAKRVRFVRGDEADEPRSTMTKRPMARLVAPRLALYPTRPARIAARRGASRSRAWCPRGARCRPCRGRPGAAPRPHRPCLLRVRDEELLGEAPIDECSEARQVGHLEEGDLSQRELRRARSRWAVLGVEVDEHLERVALGLPFRDSSARKRSTVSPPGPWSFGSTARKAPASRSAARAKSPRAPGDPLRHRAQSCTFTARRSAFLFRLHSGPWPLRWTSGSCTSPGAPMGRFTPASRAMSRRGLRPTMQAKGHGTPEAAGRSPCGRCGDARRRATRFVSSTF